MTAAAAAASSSSSKLPVGVAAVPLAAALLGPLVPVPKRDSGESLRRDVALSRAFSAGRAGSNEGELDDDVTILPALRHEARETRHGALSGPQGGWSPVPTSTSKLRRIGQPHGIPMN